MKRTFERQTPALHPTAIMLHFLNLPVGRRFLIAWLGLTLLLPVATTWAADPLPTREGIWKPIAAVLGGVRLPDEALRGITLEIVGDRYVVTVTGEAEPDRGTTLLDTTTSPKRMTLKSLEGPNQGKTFLAIYEQKDANSMRVCYDLSGTDFPKSFQAPKGTRLYLVGYRRQAPPADEK